MNWIRTMVCAVIALGLCGSEAYLAVLQSVAWSGMLVSYSAEDGLRRGAEKTFSGEAPCPLCTAVAAERERQEEGSTLAPPVPPSIHAVAATGFRLTVPTPIRTGRVFEHPTVSLLAHTPPVPPPRLG